MKYTARDWQKLLGAAAPSWRAVLFYGPDEGQVRERAEQLAQRVLGAGADGFSRLELHEAKLLADPALLADELNAMSLLSASSERVVVLRDATDKSTALLKETLASPTANRLIVTAGELGPRASLRALFEGQEALISFACYRDEGSGLAQVIQESLRSFGVTLAPDAMPVLQARLGQDRGVTRQELEKLALYVGSGGTVTASMAEDVLCGDGEGALDRLAYAVFQGNPARLFQEYEALQREGIPPIVTVRAAMRHGFRLQQVCEAMRAGSTAEAAIQQLRPAVFFKLVDAFRAQVSMWDVPALLNAQALLLAAERDAKRHYTLANIATARALARVALSNKTARAA